MMDCIPGDLQVGEFVRVSFETLSTRIAQVHQLYTMYGQQMVLFYVMPSTSTGVPSNVNAGYVGVSVCNRRTDRGHWGKVDNIERLLWIESEYLDRLCCINKAATHAALRLRTSETL